MKKKILHKALSLLLAILIIGVVYVGVHTIYVQAHRSVAVEYLVDKYGFNSKKLVLLNYKPSTFRDDTNLGIPFDWYWTSPTWKFRYNGRTFGVSKDDEDMFYDDYQMEDIFEWSVEYLKNNVDENIVAIKIENGDFTEKFSENNIDTFIKSQSKLTIYYKVDNLDNYFDYENYETKELYENLKQTISEKCKTDDLSLLMVNCDLEFSRKIDSTREVKYTYSFTTEHDYILYNENKLVGD